MNDTNKVYDPFSPPPEGYDDRITPYNDSRVLAKLSSNYILGVYNTDQVRASWPKFDWWLPLPPAPVRPKRYMIEDNNQENLIGIKYRVVDAKTTANRAFTVTKATAEAVAELLERMEGNE